MVTAPVEPGRALQPLIGDYALVGRLIDGAAGGWFSINPTGVRSARRCYRAGSGIVETRWETATGEVLLTEGMVLDLSGRLLPQALLVRRAECTGGEVDAAVCSLPAGVSRVGTPRPKVAPAPSSAVGIPWSLV